LTFQDAQLKLLDYVRDRIQSGELTERGLARLIGISQPHAHNVLKGARNLSPEIFDSMLKYLAIIPSPQVCEVEWHWRDRPENTQVTSAKRFICQ
jgi:hypothetical protein